MKRTVLILAFFLVSAATPVFSGDGDAVLGVWATDPDGGGGQAHVEIFAEGDRFAGKIVWLEQPLYTAEDEDDEEGEPKVDKNNPDPALQSRPIVGLRMLEGFRYDGKGMWHKGTIYDPDNGKTYKCKVRFGDDGILKVRGFIGFSMMGRTSEWTRVEEGG
jgi:uncharacterized protein (DUF2147 family)